MNEGVQLSTIHRSFHLEPHQMSAIRNLYQYVQLGHYPTQEVLLLGFFTYLSLGHGWFLLKDHQQSLAYRFLVLQFQKELRVHLITR